MPFPICEPFLLQSTSVSRGETFWAIPRTAGGASPGRHIRVYGYNCNRRSEMVSLLVIPQGLTGTLPQDSSVIDVRRWLAAQSQPRLQVRWARHDKF